MKKGIEELKRQWDENPMTVIAVVSGAALAAAKLITAMSTASNSRAWKKEVKRRDRKDRRRVPEYNLRGSRR